MTSLKSSDQLSESLRQRAANEAAKASGSPLPYPNRWDALDLTKVAPNASFAEKLASYKAFRAVCRPGRPSER